MNNNNASSYRYVRPEIVSILASDDLFTKAEQAADARIHMPKRFLNWERKTPKSLCWMRMFPNPIKTNIFAEKFPERSFNFGVAEQNMMAAAAGMATTGLIPFAQHMLFLPACAPWTWCRNSIHYPRLNVKIAASHSGITPGPDGVTHQGQEDLSIIRSLPVPRSLHRPIRQPPKWQYGRLLNGTGRYY